MAGINLNFDWDGLNYSALNGFHPLFNFFIRKNEGVTELKYKVYEFMEKTYYYEKFEPEYLKTLTNIRELNANDINFNLTWNFFDIDEQFLTEILAKDIYFCHTFPLSIGIRDFIFHLEDIKSLFIPLEDFYTKSVNELHGSKFFIGYVKYLEKILSSDKCLSILCHYQETADELVKLFTHDSVGKKIKMLNIVSLHRGNTPKISAFQKKNRILFTHSYHGNQDSIKSRGIDGFMLLCKNLLDSSLANNIRPTLIVPADFKGVIPSCLNIQVFYGFIPTEIYENLLKETMFHFLSSQSVHTKVVVDCINNSIYPICLKHNAYLELGLNESNSIFLSDNTTKTLGFKSNTQDFLLTPDQVQVIVNKVKKILKYEELKSKILEYDNLQNEIQPNVNTISSLTSLNSHIASLQGKKDFSYETPYGNEEVDLSCDHFKTSPRFLLHSRFNGLSIFYNRQVYLFTRLQSYPNKISINYLKNSKVFFRNRYSIVFFKNLSEVPLALEWSSTFDSGQYLFKYPNGLKEMLKYHIQKHEFTFLMLRASYRIIKKTSRTVHRFIKP